jgi:hypothetical protein
MEIIANDNNANQAVEQTQVATQTPESTSAPEIKSVEDLKAAASKVNSPAPVTTTTTPTPTEPPAYTPSGKFKYTGKVGDKWGDAEGEFDEVIKAAIKSKEDEEKWQKWYSKAHGFDFVQHKRESLQNELKQYQTEWKPIIDLASKVTKAYQTGDMDAVFETLGIPYEKIQGHVYNKLRQSELPAEQQQIIQQNQAYQRQLQQYQEQMNGFQQNNLQIQSQLIENELNQVMSKPDVNNFVKAFEAANGPGSFEQEVRDRGNAIYHSQNGRIASPSEVVGDVIKKFSFAIQNQTPQANVPSQTQSAPASNTIPAAPKEKPTIPMVSGGGGSPTHEQFKTAEDLKKYRAEKFG